MLERLPAGLGDRPYGLLAIAMIGWAATGVVGRLAVGHVSPMLIVAIRLLIVLLVLSTLAPSRFKAELRLAAPHWPYLLAMGALGYTAFSAFFYWSARYTSAVNMGVIQGVSPALVLVGGFLIYGTRFSVRQMLGVLLTLLGVAFVATRGSAEVLRTLAFNIGDIAVFVSALLFAGYTIAMRSRPALTPFAIFAAMTLGAFLTSLPLVAIEIARGEVIWPDGRGWLALIFIGLVPSLLSQVAYMRGVELIGPGRAGIFLNLIPVTAALFGVAIGEHFASYHAAALACVIGGIGLAEWGRRDA